MGDRDWEGEYQKPPKESSNRPDGKTVGMAVLMFIGAPAVLVVSFAWYLLDGYGVI